MSARRRLVRYLAVAAILSAGTIAMTWPVVLHLGDHLVVPRFFIGHEALPTSPDTYLHLWILAWVHQALTSGASLFDAPILHPARLTLAGSEHMLGHWPIHAPVYAASGNPVLAYQWVLLASFLLTAFAGWAVARRVTGSFAAGLVGAVVLAFSPVRFWMIDTVQHENVAGLALFVLFADRFRRDGRNRDLVAASLAVAWQSLCSYYLAYGVAVAAVLLSAATLVAAPRRGLLLGLGALAGLVPLALVSVPYLTLRAAAVVPEYGDAWLRAASARPSWLVGPDLPLFLGWIPLGLAAVGLVSAWRTDLWRAAVACGLVLVGIGLALGPTLAIGGWEVPLPYRLLHAWVPGFSTLRYPYRFGVLATLGLALLASHGWRRLAPRRRGRVVLVALVLVAIGAEYRRAPLPLVRVDVGADVPPVYRWLAEHGQGRALLEWPMPPPGDLRAGYEHARTMAFAIHHRLPLLNGYTAYEPPSQMVVALLAERLPDPLSAATLVDLTGVGLVLLHRDRLDAATRSQWEAWVAEGGCRPLVEIGEDLVCELDAPRRDLRPQLLAANRGRPGETFRGLPLSPLDAGARRGRLTVAPLGALGAALVSRVRVDVTNEGASPWPGLAPLVPGVVSLRYRWEPGGGVGAVPILCDLVPDDTCAVVLPVIAPRTPGRYTLELTLGQEEGSDFPLGSVASMRIPIDVRPLGGRKP